MVVDLWRTYIWRDVRKAGRMLEWRKKAVDREEEKGQQSGQGVSASTSLTPL